MNFPKITIITPNYNQDKYLERTILSVIQQGYPNLEYIVMDGGSTDGSIEIIKKYEDHISYWQSKKDNGMYDAINQGFQKSTGDIMGWINSDDFLHPKSLFLIAKIFTDLPKLSWIQGLPNVSNDDDHIVYIRPYRQYSKLDFLSDLKSQMWIQQESTFWKRELYIKAGNKLETNYKLAGDFDLWMRFFEYEKIYAINGLIGTYRITNSNASMINNDLYMQESLKIISEIKLTIKEKIKLVFTKRLNLLKYIGNYEYIPFIRKLFNYPNKVSFDFKNNKFIIK